MPTWKNTTKLTLVLFVLFSCTENSESNATKRSKDIKNYSNVADAWYADLTVIQGKTQGTTFVVKSSEDTLLTTPNEISKLLKEFDLQLSGYISNSTLSKFNVLGEGEMLDVSKNVEFQLCYELSQDIYQRTNGAFDPSVFPLVKAWGFFKEINNPPSPNEVDSILTFTGFENRKYHSYEEGFLKKLDPRFELDFNAIAQGLSVDYLAAMLEEKGHKNYFVEIGGEIRVKGVNNEGKPWVIGIDQPTIDNNGSDERKLENYLGLKNVAVATSGNYRKFYEKNGKRYSHTLNPKTGYPVAHNLLSATVIAKTAALADGYATAFMTMGVDSTLSFIEKNPDLELAVYLLFENQSKRIERAYSSGFKTYFL
jgi:thiamine biosynthesis lipoprotein